MNPTERQIEGHYRDLGFFDQGTKWNPEAERYEPEVNTHPGPDLDREAEASA